MNATAAGGGFWQESTQTLDTLPGVAPKELNDRTLHGYFEAGVSYYARRLPKGTFDPYVRASGGLTD